MKRTIAFIMVLSLCIGLCACGGGSSNTNQQQTIPTQKPVKYEDTLIEKIKIGDPQSKVEEVFGKAISIKEEESKYIFKDVSIYGQKFTPTVYIKKDKVTQYAYRLETYTHATMEAVYTELVNNFTILYGEPNKSSDSNCSWYFLDGRTLLVGKGYFVTNYVSVTYY